VTAAKPRRGIKVSDMAAARPRHETGTMSMPEAGSGSVDA
jgi:hypothetical protein